MVEAADVHVSYDGLVALGGVSLRLAPGEVLGLIGPNGAGKTTLVNVLSGFARPDAGELRVNGSVMTGAAPAALARRGVARTFQGGRLFARLSVRENLEAAALGVMRSRRQARRRVQATLERVGAEELAELPASALTYGQERRISMARALATEPEFLLLDEPAAGLDDEETTELSQVIRSVRDDYGCGLLVIEHDMRLIMGLCERIQVLSEGRTLCVGTPQAVAADSGVREAYLGVLPSGDARR